MPSPRHATRPLRVTFVTAGLALGCLGGVAAGATVVIDAGHTAPVAEVTTEAISAVRTSALTTAAPTTARPAEAAVSRSMPRVAVRPRHTGRRHHTARHTKARHHGARRHHHAARRYGSGRHHATRHHHGRGHHHARRHHHARGHHHVVRHHHHFVLRRDGHQLTRKQKINRVIAVARSQRGKPYVWGAAGPHAFDCSGYVQWVYRHALGVHLPKYTDTQYRATRHLHGRKLRRGDLIFVRAGRHEEHVGIYAGHWRWWVAPHTGSHVKLQRIYRARHVFSRVIP